MEGGAKPFRIAAASNDGRTVNLHFGQAQEFYIYDLFPGEWCFVEKCDLRRNFGHDFAEFDKVKLLLDDCGAVIVSKIGPAVAEYLLNKGLRIFEAPYPIAAVLEKLCRLDIF